MEHLNSLTRYDMPEMSEVLTTFFGGEKQKVKAVRKKKAQWHKWAVLGQMGGLS